MTVMGPLPDPFPSELPFSAPLNKLRNRAYMFGTQWAWISQICLEFYDLPLFYNSLIPSTPDTT
jgi:hypothetical protein